MTRDPIVSRIARALAVAALASLVISAATAGDSSSPSYVLRQGLFDVAGGESTSFGYVLNGSAGQPATVGASSSPRFVLQSGLWGHVGSGLVPVFLSVERSLLDPDDVDLSWSGNNAPYDIYRSSDCGDVYSSFLDQTPGTAYTDTTVGNTGLHCYSVLATAPGPSPPPPQTP